MRDLPTITSVWETGGPFIGDNKPTTRVTVQSPWPELAGVEGHELDFLRTTDSDGIGSSVDRGVPMRWWQPQDNAQTTVEIPNIASVSIDRSIGQDAASISLSIYNQWMYDNDSIPDQETMGQPGFFSANRGDSAEAGAMWGHTENQWADVIAPNALLRVYTGFGGGDDPDVLVEVAAGNLALYGVFLIDEVSTSTDGMISVRGRDMAKLLIEQQLFPPLVPSSKYPLEYYRWDSKFETIRNAAREVPTSTGTVTFGDKTTVYEDSAVDHWYGSDASLYGHRGSHSVDGNPNTYALSVGNSDPSRDFTTDWWQYTVGEDMNAVYVNPWKGGYTMYVSVMVGGAWQGGSTIPYDASALFASQSPAVDTGADIPYVASFTVPHETAKTYLLPQVYNAEKIRITFRDHVYSGLGVWKYRCGIREVRARGEDNSTSSFGVVDGTLVETYVQAGGYRYVPNKTFSQGYVTVGRFIDHDAFGDARVLDIDREGPVQVAQFATPTAVRFTRDGGGYYVANAGGVINTYGNATWYGDPENDGYTAGNDPDDGHIWDMAVTHTGDGYWVLSTHGQIYAYGDAVDYGMNIPVDDPIFAGSIEAHPTAMGYWVVRNDGKVYVRGGVTHYGELPETGQDSMHLLYDAGFIQQSESLQCIRVTSTGQGYWLMSSKGRVFAFGDAKDFGDPEVYPDHPVNIFTESYWEILPAPDDRGYLLLHADGSVHPFGDIENFGGPVPGGNAELRFDGNYLDYTRIVKDLLLWSGFLLYDDMHPANQEAPIFGALESTGAFAKERLPDEMFDKKPVIDAITALKEVVGYVFRVDQEGRVRFESPNWWHVGNFDVNGTHDQNFLLDIHEKIQLTDYATSTSDEALRSNILLSTYDPYAGLDGTVSYSFTPNSAPRLRGLVKPAMWVNDHFIEPNDQKIMAELIALHISFQDVVGQVSCIANPAIDIDDQVRIYERQTGETAVHYVRGVSFNHNLDSGAYVMRLTTNRVADGVSGYDIVGGGTGLDVSGLLQSRMDDQQYGKYSRSTGGTI